MADKDNKIAPKTPPKTEPKTPLKTPSKSEPKTPLKSPSKSEPKTPLKTPSKSEPKTPLKTPSKSEPKTPLKTPSKTGPKTPPKTPLKTPSKSEPKTPLKTPSKTGPKTPPKTPSKTESKTPPKIELKTPPKTPPKTPSKTPPKNEPKTASQKTYRRMRCLVAFLSCLLFVICIYFIYTSFTADPKELDISDIKWRLTTIFRLLISLLGYVGAIFRHKRILIVTMALIVVDITLTFGMYYFSYTNLFSQYEEYLVHLPKIENRTLEFDTRDCDFIKSFRRRIIEVLILISFYVIFVDAIINLINCKAKPNEWRTPVRPHPKWALALLSVFHLFYSIYLFWSKTFRSDQKEEILQKKGFGYILLWTLLAFTSIFVTIVSPFALSAFKRKDKFFLNLLVSIVVLSIFLGSAQFLMIASEEFFSDTPSDDYYCTFRLTSVDSMGSILILLIVNKIIISLFLTLSNEIKREISLKPFDKKV